jgi:hypothetical protein
MVLEAVFEVLNGPGGSFRRSEWSWKLFWRFSMVLDAVFGGSDWSWMQFSRF